MHAVVLTPHHTAPREGESVAEMGRERLRDRAVASLVLRQAVLVDPQPAAAELEACQQQYRCCLEKNATQMERMQLRRQRYCGILLMLRKDSPDTFPRIIGP